MAMAGKKRYTVEEVEEALRRSGGFLTRAAQLLKCHYSTIRSYIKKYKYLQEIEKEILETHLDFCELALLKKVKEGDLGAICFYLKCKGKQRGYIERKEFTGPDGKELGVVLLPAKKEEKVDEEKTKQEKREESSHMGTSTRPSN